jgi:WD40 repeat protein
VIPFAEGGSRCIAFSPDGKVLAAGRHGVSFWNLTRNEPMFKPTGPGVKPNTQLKLRQADSTSVTALAFSHDGSTLYTGASDGVIRSWDWKAALQTDQLTAHTAGMSALLVLPDHRIVSAGLDGRTKIWEMPGKKLFADFPGLGAVAIDPTKKTILTVPANRRPTLWSYDLPPSATTITGLRGTVTSATIDPSTGDLVSGSADGVRWHDSNTGQAKRDPVKTSLPPTALAFSPNGRWLAIGTGERPDPARAGGLIIRDPETGREAPLDALGKPVTAAAFTADGARFSAATVDGIVRIWSTKADDGFRLVRTLNAHKKGANSIAFSPDGSVLITAGGDGKLVSWDAATGEQRWSTDASNGLVHSVAYRSDGRMIATTSKSGILSLWDPTTGALLRTLMGHSGAIHAVAFSPDGTRLGSVGADGIARLWDPDRGELVMSVRTHNTELFVIVFDGSGRSLAIGGREGSLRVLHAPSR